MATIKKHPNSRIITLYRKDSFLMNAQKGSAPEFLEMAKQSLGSYWDNSFSSVVGSGLNFTEQKLLMPTLVDCEPSDRNFRTKCSEYFASIATKVPYGKGRDLEIGLETSNNEDLSETNMPLNLPDYVAYRHALNHPLVATSKAEGEGNMIKQFYLFDPAAVEEADLKINKARNEALEQFLAIIKTPQKVDMLLTMLDVDPRLYTGKNAVALKEAKLKELAEAKPDKFVEIFKGKHFEELYLIRSMINTGVLSKVGERIIDLETGDTLGHKLEEAVAWVKDKSNSERLLLLKARMQEGLSKTLPQVNLKKR